MIAKMERVEIVFLRSELSRVVPFLQDMGVMHLEDVPLALDQAPGYLHRVHLPEQEKEELDKIGELDGFIKETIPLLGKKPETDDIASAGAELIHESFEQWDRNVRSWNRNLRSIHRRRLNIQDNIEVVTNYRATLKAIAPMLAERKAVLGETARAVILEGYKSEDIDLLEKRILTDVGQECDVIYQPLNRNTLVAVIMHPSDKLDAVSELLQREGVVSVDSPDKDVRGNGITEVLDKIEEKLKALRNDLQEMNEQLNEYSVHHGAAIMAIEKLFDNRLSQLQVIEHFAQSELVCVVHGWVPSDEYNKLCTSLRREFGNKVAADTMSIESVDVHRVPIQLRNGPLWKPFQLILGLFDPPKYGSFDPTWIVAISFIMFYGFILGDAGYGLVIIGIAAWVKKKWGKNEMLHDAMTIAQWMGASSIVWGIIYLEVFGDLIYKTTGLYPLFHRADYPMVLLAIAILYGLIHIPLSLVIGIVEGYRHGHRKHAEEKLGMLIGLTALGVAVLSIVGMMPLGSGLGYFAAALLFATSLYYLVRSMGSMFAMGVMEIMGLTSNVLSYARLMALGLASVVLADLANELIYGTSGIWLLLIGIPGAGLVHMLNICIGVFSPTIHSLRLNYVEFLPKFYEPEGRNYTPFRKEIVW